MTTLGGYCPDFSGVNFALHSHARPVQGAPPTSAYMLALIPAGAPARSRFGTAISFASLL
jgi:hypothetical protein